MDTRTTFNTAEELFDILFAICRQKQQAALLIDSNGLTRIQGEIVSIEKKEDIRESVIHISGQDTIKLENVIGVNGIFHADYSEC